MYTQTILEYTHKYTHTSGNYTQIIPEYTQHCTIHPVVNSYNTWRSWSYAGYTYLVYVG